MPSVNIALFYKCKILLYVILIPVSAGSVPVTMGIAGWLALPLTDTSNSLKSNLNLSKLPVPLRSMHTPLQDFYLQLQNRTL